MSPQREKIDFEPNLAVEVTLEFDGGKPVAGRNGPQYLYWVDGGRSMFLDPAAHEQIQATGARAGDKLEITKTLRGRSIGWEVVHVVDEPNTYTAAPPAARPRPASSPAAAPAPTAPAREINAYTVQLVTAFHTAIDALIEAQRYAKTQGLDLPITADAIRSTAISVFIDRCKGGAR